MAAAADQDAGALNRGRQGPENAPADGSTENHRDRDDGHPADRRGQRYQLVELFRGGKPLQCNLAKYSFRRGRHFPSTWLDPDRSLQPPPAFKPFHRLDNLPLLWTRRIASSRPFKEYSLIRTSPTRN